MKYGIGLDCGINSVGYCIMELNSDDEPKRIVRLNSRILPRRKIQKTVHLLPHRGEKRADFAAGFAGTSIDLKEFALCLSERI